VVARAQNEVYAALNNDDKNVKMYACTPDSISMVDPTTGIVLRIVLASTNCGLTIICGDSFHKIQSRNLRGHIPNALNPCRNTSYSIN
jgi:hypothetical protein